jgi:hypothetical protein
MAAEKQFTAAFILFPFDRKILLVLKEQETGFVLDMTFMII